MTMPWLTICDLLVITPPHPSLTKDQHPQGGRTQFNYNWMSHCTISPWSAVGKGWRMQLQACWLWFDQSLEKEQWFILKPMTCEVSWSRISVSWKDRNSIFNLKIYKPKFSGIAATGLLNTFFLKMKNSVMESLFVIYFNLSAVANIKVKWSCPQNRVNAWLKLSFYGFYSEKEWC